VVIRKRSSQATGTTVPSDSTADIVSCCNWSISLWRCPAMMLAL